MHAQCSRDDARERPGGTVLRMTWKVQACPKRMRSPGINGEGELRGQLANRGSPGKIVLKRSVCVCVLSVSHLHSLLTIIYPTAKLCYSQTH